MWIIRVDYYPSVQEIAFVNTDTGECGERRLNHGDGEAEKFYRVGMEATGHARWFERLPAEPGFELWIGDPGQIKATRVRKQKTDRLDAALLLVDRFPRVWVTSAETRDLRHLLLAALLLPSSVFPRVCEVICRAAIFVLFQS